MSKDDDNSLEKTVVGEFQPRSYTCMVFEGDHAFTFWERVNLLGWLGNTMYLK